MILYFNHEIEVLVVDVLALIILNIIFPIFILMGMGMFLHRIYTFDLKTLSKLTTFYFLPVIGFVNIYESNIDVTIFFEIAGFQLLLSLFLITISSILTKVLKLNKGMAANFKNSIVLMNSGNYGLPVSQLVFINNPLGLTVQIIVMAIQNFVTFTYGLLNSVAVHNQGRKLFLEFFKMPMLYALILGVIFQTFKIKIPNFLWIPIEKVSSAFLAVALLTLGAQVAYIKIKKINIVLIISCIMRLVIAPLIALTLILLLGIEGTIAKGLFIASSFPSSRNTAQLALEYNNYPELAGQVVLLSTLLSGLTVTLVVYFSQILF